MKMYVVTNGHESYENEEEQDATGLLEELGYGWRLEEQEIDDNAK